MEENNFFIGHNIWLNTTFKNREAKLKSDYLNYNKKHLPSHQVPTWDVQLCVSGFQEYWKRSKGSWAKN